MVVTTRARIFQIAVRPLTIWADAPVFCRVFAHARANATPEGEKGGEEIRGKDFKFFYNEKEKKQKKQRKTEMCNIMAAQMTQRGKQMQTAEKEKDEKKVKLSY